MHETVELLRTQGKRCHHLAWQIGLLAIGHRAALEQFEDAIADHLGMDAQIMLVCELHDHRVGNGAKADLQRRTIVDDIGHVFADGLLHRADLWQADLQYRLLAFDQTSHLRDVHVTIAIGEGHVRIDLENHGPGHAHGSHRVVGSQTEREKAVLVHRRCHRKDRVDPQLPVSDQRRHLGKVARQIVDPAFIPARPRRPAKEEGKVTNMVYRLGIDIGVLAQRQNLPDRHAVKIPPLLGQRGQQCRRFADTRRNANEIAVLDQAHGLGCGHPLAIVNPLVNIRHACILPSWWKTAPALDDHPRVTENPVSPGPDDRVARVRGRPRVPTCCGGTGHRPHTMRR